MDLLDRLLGHDDLTTQQVLGCCRSLPCELLLQPLALGHATIAGTVRHMLQNVQIWTDLMAERPQQMMVAWSNTDVECWCTAWQQTYMGFAVFALQVADADRWDDSYLDILDDPPKRKTFGGTIAHVITHNMHHRGELIRALKHIGVADVPEGDVLSWETRHGEE